MSQVNFYVMSEGDAQARLQVACRIAEKAWRLGHQVYLHAASDEQAGLLDDLLWTWQPSSFLPHGRAADAQQAAWPVSIGVTAAAADFDGVLINLQDEPCENFQRFSRVNEIIAADEDSVAGGRQRYRYYRDLGVAPTTHKL